MIYNCNVKRELDPLGPQITHNSTHHRVGVWDGLGASSVTGGVIHDPVDPTDGIIVLQRTATVGITGAGGELPNETPRPVITK